MDARTELLSLLAKREPLVEATSRTYTGADVERAADRLSRAGPARGEVLAVRALPEAETVLSILGALAAGFAVLPLAPLHPSGRRRDVLARAGARAVMDRSKLEPLEAPVEVAVPESGTIVETSGSSGRSKLVVHALAAHLASAHTAAAALGARAGDRWLLSLPLHHVGGLAICFRALATGGRVVVPAPGERIGPFVRRTRPAFVSVVATQLRDVLENPDAVRALAEARAVLAGGGPIPHELRAAALEAGLPLHVSYGSTEAASVVALSGDPRVVATPAAAGGVLEGRRVGFDARGRIRVGGATLCLGYLENGAVRPIAAADGLYTTADLGHLDGEGTLHVTSRADLAFISGGETVDPLEIEEALGEHPAVAEVVVVGIEDTRWGHVAVALVRSQSGCRLDRDAIEAHAREHLPRHARPRAFYVLPRVTGAKPDRLALREAVCRGEVEPV